MPVRVHLGGGAVIAVPRVPGYLGALLDRRNEAPEVEALPAVVAPDKVVVVPLGVALVAVAPDVLALGRPALLLHRRRWRSVSLVVGVVHVVVDKLVRVDVGLIGSAVAAIADIVAVVAVAVTVGLWCHSLR